MAVVNGTTGTDILYGRANEADSISGFGGSDTIDPYSRPPSGDIDRVFGGPGSDTLIISAQGSDENLDLSTAPLAPDTIFVRSTGGTFYIDATSIERVQFNGGEGNDNINTGTLLGGQIFGNGGVDHWLADLSRLTSPVSYRMNAFDTIQAAGFSQITGIDRITLTTGSGNDSIRGGAYADAIATGAGNDHVNAGSRQPTAGGDVVDMGLGFDTLEIEAQNELQNMVLGPDTGGPNNFFLRSDSGNFYIDARGVEHLDFLAGQGNDVINTGTVRATINGMNGIDHWIVDGSALTQNVSFILGNTLSFPNGTSVASRVSGIERITMTTGQGNDTIASGAQADVIRTGAGNDTVNAKTRPAGGQFDFVELGTGIDTLVVEATGEASDMSLSYDFTGTTFFVRSGSGRYYVDATGVERVRFTGGHGDDRIDTGTRGQAINGGLGIDHWTANLGFANNDITYSLASTHQILANNLAISIFNIERITLTTGAGDDSITGGGQGDIIRTGSGNDTVNAGARPISGAGDFVDLGTGTDTLVVRATGESQRVTLSQDGGTPSTFYFRSDSGKYYVDAASVERVSFTGGNGHDRVETGNRAVAVNGAGGIDHWIADLSTVKTAIAFTLGVSDSIAAAGLQSIQNIEQITLTTGSGHDTLTGGAEADAIRSGAGNDTVNLKTRPVSGGGDFADLGAGVDTLVVNAAAETTSVSVGVEPNGAFTVRSNSGRFYIDAANGEQLVVTSGNGNDSLLGGSRGDRLTAGGGADVIAGGGGADTLNGGGGADRFDYNSVGDSRVGAFDEIVNFDAADILDLVGVDANSKIAGDQAFKLIFGQAFHGVAGELRLGAKAVEGDTNGDGVRDFFIQITNGTVNGADILL